ncbi:winged helix-turn-helix transcriptional regulator [Plantibacter sp. Mn2098]|uniref:winged helix-turn-helix transcriptional regulator n=1 Tax=Plantibacter sp. Mn2098 TaxID=3395266 RepID=UPI003BC249E0
MAIVTDQASTDTHAAHCDRNDVYAAACPCRDMLDLIANKWTALAIGALEDGTLRFGEVKRRLEGVSPKVLTSTLRKLEESGLIERTVIPGVPLHVEYALTDLGRSATAPLAHIRSWVEQNIHQVPAYSGHPEQSGRTGVELTPGP